MKKRFWVIGGLAAVGVLAIVGSRSAPSNLCSDRKTVAELERVFISKLSRLGGSLLDDFSVHGQRGNDLVCSPWRASVGKPRGSHWECSDDRCRNGDLSVGDAPQIWTK